MVFKNQIGYNNGEDEPFTTYIHSFNLVLINADNSKSQKYQVHVPILSCSYILHA